MSMGVPPDGLFGSGNASGGARWLLVALLFGCQSGTLGLPEQPGTDRDNPGGSLGGAADGGAADGGLPYVVSMADAGYDAGQGMPVLCGNGVVDDGESCDTALTEGTGACPTSCGAVEACRSGQFMGSGCQAACVINDITACQDGDGCCPGGCTSANDDDCGVMCGNDLVEGAEVCDGNCPAASACDDGAACTVDSLTGSAATCDAVCENSPITTCVDGDGCCASGCDHTTDNDCSTICGNAMLDTGETCDGDCPASCDDMNTCTTDTRLGDDSTCNVECAHTAIAACRNDDGCCAPGCNESNDNDCDPECGNGVIETGEDCDSLALPTANCDTNCHDICVWVIEYETDAEIEVSDALAGNGPYAQSVNGKIILQFTDDGGAPGDGPVGILYSESPTNFVVDSLVKVTTSLTAVGGTESSACPITTGTMTSNTVTWDACAFMSENWGKTSWTAADQQVPDDADDGCLPVRATGSILCEGGLCGIVGLPNGTPDAVDDTWDQPMGLTTFDFRNFTSGAESSVQIGGSNYAGSPYYPDDRDDPAPAIASTKTESPTSAASRIWRNLWSVKEISRACVPPPTCM